MPDQAHDLRQLAVRRHPASSARARRAVVLAVAGGKGGVGTTTVAINLAVAIAESDKQVVFVDADPRGADAAMHREIEQRCSFGDVLTGRHRWDDALQAGPYGLKILTGGREWNALNGTQAAMADELLDAVDDGQIDADLVVIDVGNTINEAAGRICQRADRALIVTTPTPAAVLNTYTTIETLAAGQVCSTAFGREDRLKPELLADELDDRFYLLINMASNAEPANAALDRIDWVARRLLGVRIRSAGYIPRATGALPCGSAQFCLNVRALSVDTIRELFVSDCLLRWRRREKFNTNHSVAIA